MNPWIAKNIVYSSLQRVRGESVLKVLKELEANQWLDRNALDQLQWRKLRLILEHAYESVSLYRDRFQEIGISPTDIRSPEDMTKIPLLTKEDIRLNLPQLKARNAARRFDEKSTGGSTGKPLVFLKDRLATSYHRAVMYRYRRWYGIDIGAKEGRFWAVPVSGQIREKLKDRLINRIRFSAFDISEDSMHKYYEKFCSWRSEYFYGYVSALCRFAEFLSQNQLDPARIGIRAIICTSEVLYPQQRELLERTFRCRVINEYGCTDSGVLACECPEGNMHINSDHIFIEFIDSDGMPVSPGEAGEIIITELHDFSYPLIRYRLGDVGVPSTQVCPCGRGLPLMDIVKGRISDLIMATDGRLVQDEILNYVSRVIERQYGKGIKQFKVIQRSRQDIVFQIVKGVDFSEGYLQLLDQKLHEYLGEAMNIKYEYVEDIPLEKSGKLRYFISEIQE